MKPQGAVRLRDNFVVKVIPVAVGRDFNLQHHSRLPYLQRGPWKKVFGAFLDDELISVAFWHNPSARTLPSDWIELRRMAVKDSAPPNVASAMLGRMAKYWKLQGTPRLISYQDVNVHSGGIYRAAGWVPAHVSRPRNRDRSPLRVGTTRKYRTDSNGPAPASSAKIRWELSLNGQRPIPLSPENIARAKTLKPTR